MSILESKLTIIEIDWEQLTNSAGYLAGIDKAPGTVKIDDVANPLGLQQIAEDRINGSPHLLKEAKRRGKDIVAFATSHGREIIVGAGVASLVTAATAGGIILYKHRYRRKK